MLFGAIGAIGGAGLVACGTRSDVAKVAVIADTLQALRDEARALQAALPPTPVVSEFLGGVAKLPLVPPRTFYRDQQRRRWISAAEWERMPRAEASAWIPLVFDAYTYYSTFHGSPLAYALALNVAAQHGVETLRGRKVLDYGYGAIGAVRLMADAGAQVIGIDVDPLLGLLYSASRNACTLANGALCLLQANFPGDGSQAAVGSEVQLFISKNTLKKGYVRPDVGSPQVVPPVPWPEFLRAARQAMAPGGLFLIYNISAKLDRANYRPANDPRSPFTRGEFEAAGFEVLALDADDSATARRAGPALGWNARPTAGGVGDMQTNLFAMATVVRARL
jgi:SAM-dependent methyltransferase